MLCLLLDEIYAPAYFHVIPNLYVFLFSEKEVVMLSSMEWMYMRTRMPKKHNKRI